MKDEKCFYSMSQEIVLVFAPKDYKSISWYSM